MKADASFCYCKDVSAINTLVDVRTTPQSQHIVIMSGPALMKGKGKPLHISIAMTLHEKHSKIDSSIAQECVNQIQD